MALTQERFKAIVQRKLDFLVENAIPIGIAVVGSVIAYDYIVSMGYAGEKAQVKAGERKNRIEKAKYDKEIARQEKEMERGQHPGKVGGTVV